MNSHKFQDQCFDRVHDILYGPGRPDHDPRPKWDVAEYVRALDPARFRGLADGDPDALERYLAIMEELKNRTLSAWDFVFSFDRIAEVAALYHDGRNRDRLVTLFNRDLAAISFTLYAFHPTEYVVLRKLKSWPATLRGLRALAPLHPEIAALLETPADDAGEANYRAWSQALVGLSKTLPGIAEADRPLALHVLLYIVLPDLFVPERSVRRAWLGMATFESDLESLAGLEPGELTEWTSDLEVRSGDLCFLYSGPPVSEITTILTALGAPVVDPTGGWYGFWSGFVNHAAVHIPLATLQSDPAIGAWAPAKRAFQGVTCAPIPPAVYARLCELSTDASGNPVPLPVGGPLAEEWEGGRWGDIEAFEKERLAPLVKSLGLTCEFRYPLEVTLETTRDLLTVDCLIRDERGTMISLVDYSRAFHKASPAAGSHARARTHATLLGLPTFFLGASDGLRGFARNETNSSFSPLARPAMLLEWKDAGDAAAIDRLQEALGRAVLRASTSA